MGLLNWLWSEPAPEQVLKVEQQAPSFEQRLTKIVSNSGGLSSKTAEERKDLITDISEALDILDGAIQILGATDLAIRAKQTRTRLRTTRTKAEKAA